MCRNLYFICFKGLSQLSEDVIPKIGTLLKKNEESERLKSKLKDLHAETHGFAVWKEQDGE